jgi:hypothetical protein
VCFSFNTIPGSTLLVRSELSMQEGVKRQLLFLPPPLPHATCLGSVVFVGGGGVEWNRVHYY